MVVGGDYQSKEVADEKMNHPVWLPYIGDMVDHQTNLSKKLG